MRQNAIRFLALSLSVVICCLMLAPYSGFNVAQAATVSYSGSSSYMGSKYYSQLTQVELTNNQRTNIINVARSQLGYQEGNELGQYSGTVTGSNNFTEFGVWYTNHKNPGYNYSGAQWCAMFVSWCAYVAGIGEDVIRYHSYTESQLSMFKTQNRVYTWEEVLIGEYTPKPGDVVYFLSYGGATSTSNPRTVDHVGLVESYSANGTLNTIEGNAQSDVFTTNGGCVTRRSYPATSYYVAYVCSPNYSGENNDLISVEDDYVPANVQSVVFDADYYAANNDDVVRICGSTREALYTHYITYGIPEGRQGSVMFSVKDFVAKNPTVNSLYGGSTPDYKSAIIYFGNTAAFNDTATYYTAKPMSFGSSFNAKISLTNASLNLSLSGTDVIAYNPSSAPAQVYNFVRQSDGSYKAINTKNNLVLEVSSNTKSSGTNVQIGQDTGAINQRWFIYLDHDGTFLLQPACAPACVLSVSTDVPAAMDSIVISKYSGRPSQAFKVIDPSSTVVPEYRINISSLPTKGTFTGAHFDQYTYFLNMGTGGENDSMTHSIGQVDLSSYDKLIVRYGNDPSATKMGSMVLKTASGTVLGTQVLNCARAWEATTTVEFDVSSYTNNEELKISFVNASNGLIVTRITLQGKVIPIEQKAEPDVELKINGAYLELSNDITVFFKVNKEAFVAAGYTEPYMEFEFNGEQIIENDYDVLTIGGAECYVFSFENVYSQMMNDTITATLHAKWGDTEYSSKTIEYSVAQYAYKMLESSTDNNLKKLLVDMLKYGAAAQQYSEYKTDNLVDSALTSEQLALGSQEIRTLENITKVPDYNGADNTYELKWKSGSLELKNKVTMLFSFTSPVKGNYSVRVSDSKGNFITEINSNNFSITGGSGAYVYSFIFDDVFVNQMSDEFKFNVIDVDNNVDVSGTLSYSIESYASQKLNTENVTLSNLIRTMMMYGDSVRAFAG